MHGILTVDMTDATVNPTLQGTKVNSRGQEIPQHVRLYSIASSRYGDAGDGKTCTLCVVRVIYNGTIQAQLPLHACVHGLQCCNMHVMGSAAVISPLLLQVPSAEYKLVTAAGLTHKRARLLGNTARHLPACLCAFWFC